MSHFVHVQFDEATRQAVALAEALRSGHVTVVAQTGRGNVALPVHMQEALRWLDTPLSLSDVMPPDFGWIKRK